MPAKLKTTEIGDERLCNTCGEYWPDDSEFFYMKKGKCQQPCKACYAQLPSKRARRVSASQTAARV
ncbi:MAG: hypothetical protein COB05_05365 [Marinobacter sp.]|nr:MAG: hypothetical protein COB05_05365 [Marinobacter sp.]